MSMIQTNEHIENQPSYNFNCYVKLTRLSKEEIERYTGRNRKKKNTSKLVNQLNTPNGLIKQGYVDDTMEIYETTIEHTSSQSTVQAYGINVKIEPTDVIEVNIEQENRIGTITEGSTAFSNYIKNVNRNEFICKICHDNFDNYEEYIIHKNLIHKSKPFVCNVCNAKFVLNAHLNVHLDEHADKVNTFKSTGDKSENQIISRHAKLFHCSYCNTNYKSKQSFGQHKRQHHSRFKLSRRKLKSKTVECNWCSLVITKNNLLRHIKSLHPNINPVKCLHCPLAFKNFTSLKLHVSRCHTA